MATENTLDGGTNAADPRRAGRFAGGVCALLALGIAGAGAATHPGDIALDGVTNVVVEAGSTETWSGVVSGDGGIVLSGGGTLEISNGANTFAGGVEIQGGVVKALAAGCLGTGALVTSGDGATRQFWFAAAGTYPNAIRLGGNSCGDFNAVPSVLVTADVVFGGAVAAESGQFFCIGTSGSDYGKWSARFSGAVNAAGQTLCLRTWGDFHFEGRMACESLSIGNYWSSCGLVHLYSSDNAIGVLSYNSGSVVCHAEGALGGARLYVSQNWSNSEGVRNRVDLNGFPQAARSLDFNMSQGSDYLPVTEALAGAAGGSPIGSQDGAARLTITGEATDRATLQMVDDPVELTLDAADFSTFTQTFRYRRHGTCRPLRVQAGTLTITNGSTFASVPELYVGEGGTVRVDDSDGAFAGVTNLTVNGVLDATVSGLQQFPLQVDSLTIGPNGSLRMADGLLIQAKEVTIGGTTYTSGTFDASTHPGRIAGVSIVGVGAAKTAAWVAGGADTKMSTAANWSVSGLSLTGYADAARFADQGSRADVDVDAQFSRVTLSLPEGADSFTFADAGGSIGILSGLAAEASTSDAPRRFTFGTEVRVAADQTWELQTNDTVALEKGFSTGEGSKVELRNGTYLWSGTNTVSAAVTVTGGVLVVSGKIATPDHEWRGEVDQSGNGRQLNLCQAGWQKVVGDTSGIDAVLVLSNAQIECGVNMGCSIGTMPVRVRAGTTNEISGHFLHGKDGWGGIRMEDSSELVLSGGFANSFGATRMSGTGTIRFRNRPVRATASAGFNPSGGHYVFEVADNTFSCLALGYNAADVCSAEFTVSDAMTNGILAVGSQWAGSADKFIPSTYGSGLLDVNATTQRVERLAVFGRGTLRGAAGSLVRVYGPQGTDTSLINASRQLVEGAVEGGVGLEMCGDGTLTLTNRAFASSGDIIASSGTLDFASGATWLNGTNVTVRGTGLLRLGQRAFGKQAKLRLADEGRLSLASGVLLRVSECWVGDERISGGTYTRENAPEALRAHLDESFAGTLAVRLAGFRLILR